MIQQAIFFHIPSQNKKETQKDYKVIRRPSGEWKCECPAYIFERGYCKHIKIAIERYERSERVARGVRIYGLDKSK